MSRSVWKGPFVDPNLLKKHISESLNSTVTTVLDIDIDGSV